jgi:hypothetical protein
MEKRKLGTSNLRVSPLAFGGNVFGWTVSTPMAFKLLDALLIPVAILLIPRMFIAILLLATKGVNLKR